MLIPSLSALKTVNNLISSWSCNFCLMSALLSALLLSVSSPISAPLTAFIMACSKLGAMLITSPVAFICVPSLREAFTNLSNGHLGSLTTT